jgi:hypothetical protein
MQHAEILYIGPVAEADVMDIPPNHGVKPHAALLAHDDVTDHDPSVLDKAGPWNGGCDALKRPNHRSHDRGIGLLPARGSLTVFWGLS